jgi:hypothetical protein
MMNDRELERQLEKLGQDVAPGSSLKQAVLAELEQLPEPRILSLPIWRRIMRSPMTRIAIAAVFVCGSVIGLMMWTETSSFAVADVLAQLEQVEAYRYQTKVTYDGPAVSPEAAQRSLRSTVLFADAWGAKITLEGQEPLMGTHIHQEMYFLPHRNLNLHVLPEEKKYAQVNLSEEGFAYIRRSNDPRLLVKMMLAGEHTPLGQDQLDGLTVEGFKGSDPNLGEALGRGPTDVTIWVDTRTELPVRIECTSELSGGALRLQQVMYDFQWHCLMTSADFEPNLPSDYSADGHPMMWIRPDRKGPKPSPKRAQQADEAMRQLADMPQNEETVVKALAIFKDMGGGYPEQLDMETTLREMERIYKSDLPGAVALREKVDAMTADQRSQFNMNRITPIRGLVGFYKSLVKDQRDVVYHGQSVKSTDAHWPLLRWRATDRQYRVIFGDLHTETISQEQLLELEQGLR